jgi:hypothetical protein
MSFWNPAEIIGDRAGNLAYSLHKYLILNRAWNEGLLPLGYQEVPGDLMVRLGNKPYVDVVKACTALLPAALDANCTEKLLTYYTDKLEEHPELHDKIEFELVHNVYTPSTEKQLMELESVLSPQELGSFKHKLMEMTAGIFKRYTAVRDEDLKSLRLLEQRRCERTNRQIGSSVPDTLALAVELLKDARSLATPQFARMARLAFVGNQYLKGLVAAGALGEDDVDDFNRSIETVASVLERDFAQVIVGDQSIADFMTHYGHLRPGTYDITRLPYCKSPEYFAGGDGASLQTASRPAPGVSRPAMASKISGFLHAFPIEIDPGFLLQFIEETTQYRELFKFEFTKNLSIALELLAEAGERLGFSREELEHLSLECIQGISDTSSTSDIKSAWRSQIEGRRQVERLCEYVSLPGIVFGPADLDYVQALAARPNYVSQQTVEGELVDVESLPASEYDRVRGNIALLEKADPGFDWLFSRNIKGLITRFGGVASHMAIRCAEFGIPAAIGCGELLYTHLKGKRVVVLDCRNHRITAVR